MSFEVSNVNYITWLGKVFKWQIFHLGDVSAIRFKYPPQQAKEEQKEDDE